MSWFWTSWPLEAAKQETPSLLCLYMCFCLLPVSVFPSLFPPDQSHDQLSVLLIPGSFFVFFAVSLVFCALVSCYLISSSRVLKSPVGFGPRSAGHRPWVFFISPSLLFCCFCLSCFWTTELWLLPFWISPFDRKWKRTFMLAHPAFRSYYLHLPCSVSSSLDQ